MKRYALPTIAWLLTSSLIRAQLADPLPVPLKLPPGLVQVLPLNKDASYFGDALRTVDCPADQDNPFGTCGNLLFGGLAMTDAHVQGQVRIRFSPPVNGISHFEVSHPGGLAGDDGVLSAPQFFRLPVKLNLVADAPGWVSSGDLNLNTGEVNNLEYNVLFINTAIIALANVNPKLEPPVIRFPGVYGSAWAEFEQRPDGLLDFTFYGSTFLPLGKSIDGDVPRFPLPFCTFRMNCASIESPGTSLHPHLALSTKELPGPACGNNCPEITPNSVVEFETYTHNTSFGDAFRLNIPALGGEATGRSHLLGRLTIQFGERFGDSIPFAVSSSPPEALLAEPPETPLSVPGISIGLVGHNEFLRFPKKTYFLQDVAFADDPFDVTLGAINVKTGRVIAKLLYRGFIAQDLLFTLLIQNDGRIAPSSFNFRGPAQFERGAQDQTIFRFGGNVLIDFSDLRFPSPDHIKANSFLAGPGSVLDPFLRIQAISPKQQTPFVMQGKDTIQASTGEVFSYTYSLPCDPAGRAAQFEYTNQNPQEGGTFKMHSLAAVKCFNSRTSQLPVGQYDTVSFTGFGTWSKDTSADGLHLVTAQISTSPLTPYVSIQIDGGFTSNVNTKPPRLEDSLP